MGSMTMEISQTSILISLAHPFIHLTPFENCELVATNITHDINEDC